MSTAPPQCSVFAGTRLWDESALELLVRVDTTAHAAPLLPFRGTDEVLLTGRRRDAAAGERERSGLARRRGGRNGAVQGAGHIVEICGPSGSGKTACCLHAVSECVMPRELGGHGGGALIVDCDGKLDLVRLHQIIEMKASERLSGAGMPPDSLSSVVSGCLARAYVTRSWNTLQLLSTTFYMNHSFENMIAKGIKPRLLVLDTVSAFYWADRCVRSCGPSRRWEQANQGQLAGTTDFALGTQRAHQSLADDVALAAGRYDLIVIASTAIRGRGGARRGERGELMAPSWQSIVDDRLILDRLDPGASCTTRYAYWEGAGDEHRDCFDICDSGIQLRGEGS